MSPILHSAIGPARGPGVNIDDGLVCRSTKIGDIHEYVPGPQMIAANNSNSHSKLN